MSYLVVLVIGIVVGFTGCISLIYNGYIKIKKG